jgi:membrane protein YdbS with pleckstrin-like domain
MLLVPVFLWALSNPLLAAGVVVLIGVVYMVSQVGIRVVRRHSWRVDSTAHRGSR